MTITVVMIIMVDARVKVGIGEGPVFRLASLSITVLLGGGKLGSLQHLPDYNFHSIGACISCQSWISDFVKLNIVGGRMDGVIPQACPTPGESMG